MRKIVVILVTLLLSAVHVIPVIVPHCRAQESERILQFTAGKTAVTSNGSTILMMPVPAVYDATSKKLLLPIVSVTKLLNWSSTWDAKSGSCTLISGKHKIVVKVGSKTATVDGLSVTMSAAVLNVLGNAVTPADLLQFMGASVSMTSDGRCCTVTLDAGPAGSPVATTGAADLSAVTRISRTVAYAGKRYTFEIVRIDLQGKGIQVVPIASAGGINSGSPYSAFSVNNPLAMINALPFDTTAHVTTGSLGGNGVYPQVKPGYVETIAIDANGVPFYAEGRLDVRVDAMAAGHTTSMTTYSINSTSWGGFTVYTNWYPKPIWIGSDQELVVVDHERVVQRVRGATFQPKLMKTGQYAVHGYQAAINHWTTDTITSLRNAESVRLRILLGERDLSAGFFIQSAPVLLRSGQPVAGADGYAESYRMTKSGARSFLGIGGDRYLYFIASPTAMSLRNDNVGWVLAQLGLFSDVISLDGGGSTTLYYKGSYIYAPCRQLVTCLVVPR